MKCLHEHCNCQAGPGLAYCSPECESQLRDEGATECHCGHQRCVESQATQRDSTIEPESGAGP
ncbi:MAG TPA: hypothetical protein VMT64_13090, partial [Candidatus Binataceae bacterium]|nr:hypothetical protein [Candidatus Binataceae bacterium]